MAVAVAVVLRRIAAVRQEVLAVLAAAATVQAQLLSLVRVQQTRVLAVAAEADRLDLQVVATAVLVSLSSE